ncbi:MAG: proteasome subunit alpha [Thermoproteota archaeon]|nr:proteasome subunit alpha [Thermoproteota archaeon]
MPEDGSPIGSQHNYGNGSSRYPYYYGQGGRLVLVDSALEAVNRGSTTIGIKTPEFALISSHIKPTLPLVDPNEKIFTIDKHIGATGSGYIADIEQLIEELRLQAQKHRLSYDSPIDIKSLVKHLGTYLHNYTIYAVRPHAASIIISGLDENGIHLYEVDPGGTYLKGSGFAIGYSSDIALDTIQKGYGKNMTPREALELANSAIEKAVGESPVIESGMVTSGGFSKVIK